MIDTLLSFLTQEVNQYLTDKASSGADTVEVTPLVSDTGKYAFASNKIALSIVNIEEEKVFKAQIQDVKQINGLNVFIEPEIKINLDIIFAANYSTYTEALKQISNVILYFQSHHAFTNSEFPGLGNIEKVTAELLTLNYEQLNQVWAFLGAKYLPSVIYKLRMVVMQDLNIDKVMPPVTKVTGKFINK